MNRTPISADDFACVQRLVQCHSAVVIAPGKEYLVEARLEPLVKEYGLASIGELVRELRSPECNGLATRIVEAMMTTETSFFRDHTPFASLRSCILPELIRRRAAEKTLNIWSAACATGQEIYTIAMILREEFPQLSGWTLRLLASDLSHDVLNRSQAGRYTQTEVNRGLPAAYLVRYFGQEGLTWIIRDDIRAMVQHFPINLAGDWPALPRMDVVFLRNVMIYFGEPTKKAILAKVGRLLRPDGYLALGGAETTFNVDDSFQRGPGESNGYYQLVPRSV